GTLPTGLSLNACSISSCPTATGTFYFDVHVNGTVKKSLSITIDPAALVITSSSLPNGTVGVSYSQALNATGGTGSYQWTVTGNQIGRASCRAGSMSGIPTAAGTFDFDVQ